MKTEMNGRTTASTLRSVWTCLLMLGGRLLGADVEPPVIGFGTLRDDAIVMDLAAIGGSVTDDSGGVASVTVSIREVDPVGGAGRWWNGTAWQAAEVQLPGAVSGTVWQKGAGVALPPLNSGMRFDLTAVATDAAGNASMPARVVVGAETKTLTWDPGTTHEGTAVLGQPHLLGGSHVFRIVSRSTEVGAWRTALRVTSGNADVYLRQGAAPNAAAWDFGSAQPGSDGFVIPADRFQENQEWFVLVRSDVGATWSLVSGEAYVMNLGNLPAAGASGDTAVTVGPEGWRFFRTVIPSEALAWRLWLHGASHPIHVRRGFAPSASIYDLKQAGAMLVVPDYLQADTTYLVGVPASVGSTFTFHSRQQAAVPMTFGASLASETVNGFPYVTYRVEVPIQQVAWEIRGVPAAGNTDLAVRRGMVPNEWNNDAYSEVPGAVSDSVTLVPPGLSDGVFYITTYGAAARTYGLRNGEPTITSRPYASVVVNDEPARAGWRYYVVDDVAGQLGTLGWDVVLSGQVPGTEIALRRNAVPGRWRSRVNGFEGGGAALDHSDLRGFLQRPGHQADIWYVGIYQPDINLGPFTLKLAPLAPVLAEVDGAPSAPVSPLPGRWQFFRVDFPGSALGMDLRLVGITAGMPRMVVRRDLLPESFTSALFAGVPNWPTGTAWGAGYDAARYGYDSLGRDIWGRTFIAGRDNPLNAGTYYVGVRDDSNLGPGNYALQVRGIGIGFQLPVRDLAFAGVGGVATVTTALPASEVAYYRVPIPSGSRSWRVRLTPTEGEALLLVERGVVPSVATGERMDLLGGGRRLSKTGSELLVVLPREGEEFIGSGDMYLAVVSEGIGSDRGTGRSGTGGTKYVLESLGELPVESLGTVPVGSGTELARPVTLVGGEVQVLKFELPPGVAAVEVRLDDRVGNPSMALHAGSSVPAPHLVCCSSETEAYGADGGWYTQRRADSRLLTLANPAAGTYTVTVKAEATPDGHRPASANLKVRAVAPAGLAFDGGLVPVVSQEPRAWRFFQVLVPAGPLGWDLRLNNVAGGSPLLMVRRSQLPALGVQEIGIGATEWVEGIQMVAGQDLTWLGYSQAGSDETGRILVNGMGNVLAPGIYQVGVFNTSGDAPTSYSILSRGIGSGQSIPVHELAFTGGGFDSGSLASREAVYFRVVVPEGAAGWKLRMVPTAGDAMMVVKAGTLPSTFNQAAAGTLEFSGARVSNPRGETFVVLPSQGATSIAGGVHHIAVVSQGAGGQPGVTIGNGVSAFRIESIGVPPISDLGTVPTGVGSGLLRRVELEGGEVGIYRFRVGAPAAALEVRLENRSGKPDLTLRRGTEVPYPQVPSSDIYGVEGGWTVGRFEAPGDAQVALISRSNPDVGEYVVTVRAGFDSAQGRYGPAGADLRVRVTGGEPLAFDGGRAEVSEQAPGTWRFWAVTVPAGALGWDLRLQDIVGGNANLYVRRDLFPSFDATALSLQADGWPSGVQLNPTTDFTLLRDPDPVTGDYTGHFVTVGRGGPLEAGTYLVGVYVSEFGGASSYGLLSRGIGAGMAIPVVPLAFAGGVESGPGLAPREVAWYSVDVPEGVASWKVKLDASQGGEAMLVVRRGRLPNASSGAFFNRGDEEGRFMTKQGSEHYLLLPEQGREGLTGGTYYLGVVSEGVGPEDGAIGTGLSPYSIRSFGVAPVTALGTVPAVGARLERSVSLEGGETALFRFEVPPSIDWLEVRLADRLGAPAIALRPGTGIPNPAVPVRPFGVGYGVDGGQSTFRSEDSFLVTLVRPESGTWSATVKAEQANATDQLDASARLVIERRVPGTLAFVGGTVGGVLADNQRVFYRVEVPEGALGWKLELVAGNGAPTVRARRGVLPADADAGFVGFGGPTVVIAPPVLQAGSWFVEVKGGGVSEFTLRSTPVELRRPAWAMPAFGGSVTTAGLPADGRVFADSGIDPAGAALPGDQGVDLGAGDYHFYRFDVPEGNGGLLRGELLAISGNPDAYVRSGALPTLNHGEFTPGILHDFALEGTGSEYGNWVPLDGRLETQLAPGPWYVAVRARESNVRYRLRLSLGTVATLASGVTLTGQSIAAGDWRYYRVVTPAGAPQQLTVTWSAQQGDADVYLRDTLPPGEPQILGFGYRDWGYDRKNAGPYPVVDTQGTSVIGTPPLRPGAPMYLGFRAVNDATFTVRVDLAPAAVGSIIDVPFFGGDRSVVLPPGGRAHFRVTVPASGTSWRHRATHSAAVSLYLDQGTLPSFEPPVVSGYIHSTVGSAGGSLVQFLGTWPWINRVDYYLTAVNTSGTTQSFRLEVDGRNAATDDTDGDGLPDGWEMGFFGTLAHSGTADPDRDGIDNATEFAEGTNPGSAASLRPRLTVEVSGGGRVVKEPDFATYPAGQVVRMFAVPDSGYAFVRWEGAGIASTANPLTITLTANVSVTAVFESGEVPLLAGMPVIAGGGEFRATFTGPSASALVIEASSDLEVWTEIRRIEPFTGNYVLEIPEPVGAGRFFRARTIP